MKSDTRQRARRRLDERLLALKPEAQSAPKGWLRAIHDALGMTGVQFACRQSSSRRCTARLSITFCVCDVAETI